MKDFDFHYVVLIFIVNMHGFFLWETKKCIEVTNAFQKILKSVITNQTNSG